MDDELHHIAEELEIKYGINSYFYPGISLVEIGGIQRELKEAKELAQKNNIEPTLEFYRGYLELKREIIELIMQDKELTAKIEEYNKGVVGLEVPSILLFATPVIYILYDCVIKPYCQGYFHKLGELRAEEKYKQIKKNISNKAKKLSSERDREIIQLIINKLLEKYFLTKDNKHR